MTSCEEVRSYMRTRSLVAKGRYADVWRKGP